MVFIKKKKKLPVQNVVEYFQERVLQNHTENSFQYWLTTGLLAIFFHLRYIVSFFFSKNTQIFIKLY